MGIHHVTKKKREKKEIRICKEREEARNRVKTVHKIVLRRQARDCHGKMDDLAND